MVCSKSAVKSPKIPSASQPGLSDGIFNDWKNIPRFEVEIAAQGLDYESNGVDDDQRRLVLDDKHPANYVEQIKQANREVFTLYSLAREFEDIVAIVDSIGAPAHLLGHSFGALCALEAALLTPNIQKLILYEPAIPLPDAPVYPEGLIDRLQALLDAGEEEAVVTTLYREVAMLSPDEIQQLKASAAWPSRVATAHTLPREARAEESYWFDPLRFSNLATPVLLLLGGNSPESYKTVTHLLAKAVPNSHVAVIPRQQHIAMYTAPELANT